MEYKEATLQTINHGAALELFEEEFKKVLGNINDISVDAEAVREIKLIFKIKPSKDRQTAVTTVEAQSKLANVSPHGSAVYLTFSENKPKAYVHNVKQTEMEFDQKKGA